MQKLIPGRKKYHLATGQYILKKDALELSKTSEYSTDYVTRFKDLTDKLDSVKKEKDRIKEEMSRYKYGKHYAYNEMEYYWIIHDKKPKLTIEKENLKRQLYELDTSKDKKLNKEQIDQLICKKGSEYANKHIGDMKNIICLQINIR